MNRRFPMRIVRAGRTAFALAVALAMGSAFTAAQAAEEDQLKRVWDAHQASPQLHAEVKTACAAFARACPSDPLLPVVHGILAWHLFQEGAADEALKVLQPGTPPPPANPDPVFDAARRIANAWTTRVIRGKVVQALQAYYRSEVAYPPSLAALAAFPRIASGDKPPLTDAFGEPWDYRLTGVQGLPGFEAQRYRLQSGTLGESSDLAFALKSPYGKGLDIAVDKVLDEVPPKVILRAAGGTGLLLPGQEFRGVSLVFAGRKIVVLANHSYWKVAPRP